MIAPEDDCDHFQVDGIEEIALSCVPIPELSCMFEKLLTPPPPDQFQDVDQDTVFPFEEVRLVHWLPEAPPDPHKFD